MIRLRFRESWTTTHSGVFYLPECAAMTCSESRWSHAWLGLSDSKKARSNLLIIAELILMFSATDLVQSKLPPAGLAAANTAVLAGRVAQMPAFATVTSCCSMAPRMACKHLVIIRSLFYKSFVLSLSVFWERMCGTSWTIFTLLHAAFGLICGSVLRQMVSDACLRAVTPSLETHALSQSSTWCSLTSLSNSSMQQTPWSAKTKAPASHMYSPEVLSRITDAVRPAVELVVPQMYTPVGAIAAAACKLTKNWSLVRLTYIWWHRGSTSNNHSQVSMFCLKRKELT